MTYPLAQVISDGRAEARKLHELAERAEVHHVRYGPPGSASPQERAVYAYIEALRDAYAALTLRLDECEASSRA